MPDQSAFLLKIMLAIYPTKLRFHRTQYLFLRTMAYISELVRADDFIDDIFFLLAKPGAPQNRVFIKFAGASPARLNTIKGQDYYYSLDLIEAFVAKSQGI